MGGKMNWYGRENELVVRGEMNFLYPKYALFCLLEQLQNVEQALEHTTS